MVRVTPAAPRTGNSRRRRGTSPARSTPRLLALPLSVVALCWALPSASGAETSASVNAGEPGATASGNAGGLTASAELSSNVLQVLNANGKAAELLHRLTIAQLAALLHETTAQLLGEVQALPGYGLLSGQLGKLLEEPGATVQELLDVISAHGLSAEPVKQLIEMLLHGGVESAEQLRSVLATVLGDLAKNGQLATLAQELGVPGGVVEAASLVPATVGQVASGLGTTVERLGAALQGAGGLAQLPSALSPIVTLPVEEAAGSGATSVLGLPGGSGDLTLTTVNSTRAGQAAAGGGKPASSSPAGNGFSIVSLQVTRAGAIVETVSVPGPGSLVVSASGPKLLARRSGHGRNRVVTRKATVASLTTRVAGGVRTVILYPKRLGGGRRIPVSVATTYTPTGGSPNTIRRSVTITRATVRRKHRA
jgi:hypothetical protein